MTGHRENKAGDNICDLLPCDWQIFKTATEASATICCWDSFWKLKPSSTGLPEPRVAREPFGGGLAHCAKFLVRKTSLLQPKCGHLKTFWAQSVGKARLSVCLLTPFFSSTAPGRKHGANMANIHHSQKCLLSWTQGSPQGLLQVENNTAEKEKQHRTAGSTQDLRIVLSTHQSGRLTGGRTGAGLCYCTVNILATRKVLASETLRKNHLC